MNERDPGGGVTIMYSFDVFKRSGVTPQANAIVYGIKSGLLPASAASDFGEYRMVCYGEEGSIDLLIFEGSPEEAVKALAAAGYVDDGQGFDVLRLAVLSSLGSSGQDLLDDIEGVYADFGYPSDMESFIYYMPNDGGESSPEALIRRFHAFVASERERLGL